MGKGQKQKTAGMAVLQGTAAALALYGAGAALLAWLLVGGRLPETAAFPALAVLCVLAALVDGSLCARRTPWGTLPSALLGAAAFAAVLAGVGAACWGALTLTGRGGILLLCALAGGCLAGLLGGRRRGKGKRKRK